MFCAPTKYKCKCIYINIYVWMDVCIYLYKGEREMDRWIDWMDAYIHILLTLLQM